MESKGSERGMERESERVRERERERERERKRERERERERGQPAVAEDRLEENRRRRERHHLRERERERTRERERERERGGEGRRTAAPFSRLPACAIPRRRGRVLASTRTLRPALRRGAPSSESILSPSFALTANAHETSGRRTPRETWLQDEALVCFEPAKERERERERERD